MNSEKKIEVFVQNNQIKDAYDLILELENSRLSKRSQNNRIFSIRKRKVIDTIKKL